MGLLMDLVDLYFTFNLATITRHRRYIIFFSQLFNSTDCHLEFDLIMVERIILLLSICWKLEDMIGEA